MYPNKCTRLKVLRLLHISTSITRSNFESREVQGRGRVSSDLYCKRCPTDRPKATVLAYNFMTNFVYCYLDTAATTAANAVIAAATVPPV